MSDVMQVNEIAAKLGVKTPWKLLDFACKNDETHFAGFKSFTANEQFFTGHFPVHPIVPGVLQIEAMRQLCFCFLPGDVSEKRIKRLEKVKFRNPVVPGDRMIVEAEVISSDDETWVIKAVTKTVAGVCCEAMMTVCKCEKAVGGISAIPALECEYPRNGEIAMDTDKVMQMIPHRFPFLLVDYVAVAESSRTVAIKNISGNEPFFDAGFTRVPDVLLCEIAAQSGCASILSRPENVGKLGFFMAINKAEFHRQILPGEQLIIEFDLPESKSRFGKSAGVIRVGNEVVAEMALMFAIVEA